MTDSEIVAEIYRRITEWFKTPGWAEENEGFATVASWIEEMKRDSNQNTSKS